MAKQNVTLSNTFNQWRTATNTMGAWLGDVGAMTQTYTASYLNLQGSSANGSGAQFDIDITAGVYSVANIDTGGTGYLVNDDITIVGSALGGVDGVHDLVLNVDTVSGTTITAASVQSGTPSPDLVAEVNISITDIGTLQLFTGEGTVLNTTATDLADAINELHGEINTNTTNIGSIGTLTTTATNLTDAINELDAVQGNDALNTTATTLTAAVNELDGQIGPTTGGSAGQILYEIYGSTPQTMTADYSGTENNIIDALNYLYAASGAATLDGEYFKLNGSNVMDPNAYMTVSNVGIRSKDAENLILSTKNLSNVDTARLTIADISGNVGIGTAPHATYKADIGGELNATNLSESGTDLSAKYAQLAATNTISGNTTFTSNLTVTNGVGESFVVNGTTISSDTLSVSEWVQDTVGAMVSTNTETGITVTYQDADGTLDFVVNDNGHNHTFSNISDGQESVEDIVGGMVSGNSESGISVTYDDALGKLNFVVNSYGTFSITDTDSGFTWAETGDIIVDQPGDTVKYVSGSYIDIDVDATNDAMRIAHADTSSAASVNNSLGVVLQDITIDGAGHITAMGSVDLDNRYSQTAFKTINVTGTDTGFTWDSNTDPADVIADQTADTLNLVKGSGILIDSDATTDALRIRADVEYFQDLVGAMVGGPSESGIVVGYDDIGGVLTFDVNDPTITLSGDVTGSATMTNLGSINISTSITSLSITPADISGFDEGTHDAMNTALVTNGSHTGISVTYDDVGNGFDIALTQDSTITLTGDVTGAGTMTNLGSVSFATNIAAGAVGGTELANSSITSGKFSGLVTLQIQNSAGTALKTIYSPGS